MQREAARLRRLGMGINRGQAPLAIEDGQPDAAGVTTEDDLKEARVDKLVAEHLSSQFRYKPLVAAHEPHSRVQEVLRHVEVWQAQWCVAQGRARVCRSRRTPAESFG